MIFRFFPSFRCILYNILVEKLNAFSLDYLFCKSDAFQAFGKRRITVVGKLLVCGNEIKDSLMTDVVRPSFGNDTSFDDRFRVRAKIILGSTVTNK